MIKFIDGMGKDIKWIKSNINRPTAMEVEEQKNAVVDILNNVQQFGDDAILEYTYKFDGVKFDGSNYFEVSENEIKAAFKKVDKSFTDVLKKSRDNILKFHIMQKQNSWMSFKNGITLGQKIEPLEKVGVYVPGGRAAYPSSVLMNVIPAKVAGVDEIIMVTPPQRDGSINSNTLVAASISGVDRIFRIGGAQAIGALAFGTNTIPQVDKIVGPGNIYVALAKKEVYGYVDIDMIAGPSEILIVADDTANPEFIAADLMSQAEHDPMACAILITTSKQLGEAVMDNLNKQIINLSLKDTIKASLANYGAIITVDSINKAIDITNLIAPEHLELAVKNPFDWLGYIKNAGAIFLGQYTPEPLGDYMAGPNHVLPTGGTAKFFSPLGVENFIKKSSVISYTDKALCNIYKEVACFARAEGLTAHANSMQVRFEKNE
ncbi:MAG: histidinol dehydrogenase [Xylanivirga thermophila]|jgi:histidinol dehydrogenase|uniref:histidinol dehydrogenase n=1 Tax=Xylanivirga thermophila TaxID=2496273 RepID=UPI0039F5F8AB